VRLLFALTVLFILYGTLYPFQFDFHRTDISPLWILLHSWPAYFSRFLLRDAVTNVLLYMPLGFTGASVFGRRWWVMIPLGIALSAGVEMLQVYDFTRNCNLADLACNSAGTILGAVAARVSPRRATRHTWDRAIAGPAIVAACWVAHLFYPFVPLLSRGHLRGSWAHFINTPIAYVEVVATAAEWFAAALLVQAVVGRLRTWWLALALIALPVRLLLADRALSPAEAIGALAALLLWAAIPAARRNLAGAALLATAIFLRELAPFDFSPDPQPFSWIPFSATFAADRVPAAVVLLRKAFDYGAMVWLVRGIGLWRAGIAVAAALAIAEFAQRYLPGRQPEITDALLALIVTLILAWGERR
jgi:VanZ family protein